MSDARLLIVSGDDFGLTDGICRGILDAHEHGVLTATSVITVGPAFEAWTPALRASDIDVGVHLTAVGEDPPTLTAAEIPTLVDDHGRLPRDWRALVRLLARRSMDPADLRRELDAQIAVAADAGLHPTHVDTHQHVHLWPSVARVVIGLAVEHGIGAVRVPESHERTFRSRGISALAGRLRQRANQAGLRSPGGFVGIDHAGHLDRTTMLDDIATAVDGGAQCIELGCHPGTAEDPDRARYRWGYRWPEELDALRDPTVRRSIESGGFRLGSFADLIEAS